MDKQLPSKPTNRLQASIHPKLDDYTISEISQIAHNGIDDEFKTIQPAYHIGDVVLVRRAEQPHFVHVDTGIVIGIATRISKTVEGGTFTVYEIQIYAGDTRVYQHLDATPDQILGKVTEDLAFKVREVLTTTNTDQQGVTYR